MYALFHTLPDPLPMFVVVATQNAVFKYELLKTRYTLNLAFKKIYTLLS